MTINYRIAQLDDVLAVYQLAENKLRKAHPDEMELMIKIWESRFRKEALEHYFKLGWSFVGYDENQQIQGFFLGQPILFFEGQTQTLWVELVEAVDFKIQADLVEIAYKLSRDKHFQRVILPKAAETLHFEKPLPFQKHSESWVWLKTTK